MADKVWTVDEKRTAFEKYFWRGSAAAAILAKGYYHEAQSIRQDDPIRAWRLYQTSAYFLEVFKPTNLPYPHGCQVDADFKTSDISNLILEQREELFKEQLLCYMNEPLSNVGRAWKGVFSARQALGKLGSGQVFELGKRQELTKGFSLALNEAHTVIAARSWWNKGAPKGFEGTLNPEQQGFIKELQAVVPVETPVSPGFAGDI